MGEFTSFIEDAWEEGEIVIERETLIASMSREFPDAELVAGGHHFSDMRDIGWKIEGADRSASNRTEIWVARGGAGVNIDGIPSLALRVIVWYRSLVPATRQVIVTDPMYSFSAPVPHGVTFEQLWQIVDLTGGATSD